MTVRLTSNDIKNGTTLEIDGAPWRVLGAVAACQLVVGAVQGRVSLHRECSSDMP